MSNEISIEAEAPAQEPANEEIDWKAKAREWERRAKDNKSAADELAALRDSQKTSEQRFEERLAEMEKRAAAAEAGALKATIAAKYGISTEPAADGSPSDADLFLTGSDADSLTKQAQRLAARDADRKKQGNVAPNEGAIKQTGSQDGQTREFVGSLFGAD